MSKIFLFIRFKWKKKLTIDLDSNFYFLDNIDRWENLPHHNELIVRFICGERATRGGNSTRRALRKHEGPCLVTNPIDRCWRCDPSWEMNRKKLADCVLGFGRRTRGGQSGDYYVVIDPSDNDMVNPKTGTLRHAVTLNRPLWIIFARSMVIRLNQELIVTSNKTIDGRGANVLITGGAGITLQFVRNVIVHGIRINNIVQGTGGLIRDAEDHIGLRTMSDGDGISIFGSSDIWVDHVSMSKCADGLIDAIMGSTAITISNGHFTNHNEVTSDHISTAIASKWSVSWKRRFAGDAVRGEWRSLPGSDDADNSRLQPFRARTGPEDAKVPVGVLPRRQQWLHSLADVRHRRQPTPDHHQPRQPVHRSPRPRPQSQCPGGKSLILMIPVVTFAILVVDLSFPCYILLLGGLGSWAGDEEGIRTGVGLEELAVEIRRWPDDERSLLRAVWESGRRPPLLESGHDLRQAGHVRHPPHALRRSPQLQGRPALLMLS